jgi:uncharacterized membrane protein
LIGYLIGFALADALVVSARQVGLIRKLPDVPGKIFDANQVTVSKAAYPFGVPDGILAVLHHSTQLGLLALGKRRLLRWSAAAGALASIYYLWQMTFRERKACVYCIGAIAANMALVPLTKRDTREHA